MVQTAERKKEYMRQYYQKNRERLDAERQQWREANPDRAKTISRKAVDAWNERNPEKRKEIEHASKLKKLARQEAIAGRSKPLVCEVCSANDDRIVFDHCHNGGHFRGWLCNNCNRVLGLMKDDPERLRKLATYLENDRG